MDWRAAAMGLTFAFIWSSAFTSARMIVADAPPMLALTARFLLSGAVAVGLAWALGQSARLSAAQWRAVLIFGICQNTLYLGLNFVAMQWIEASVAAIIASAMPLLVAGLGRLFRGDRVPPLGLAGLVTGIAGVGLVMGTRVTGGTDPAGLALCLLGALALAVATLTVRTASSQGNVLMVVGLQMFVGAVPLALCAMAFEPWEVTWSAQLILAFLYTTLVSGVFATWIWFRLVARTGAVRAATWHFLNPFFGLLIAAAFLGERFGALDALGVAVITAGILAVQWAKQSIATK